MDVDYCLWIFVKELKDVNLFLSSKIKKERKHFFALHHCLHFLTVMRYMYFITSVSLPIFFIKKYTNNTFKWLY